jgi:putative salt-induced outer membrane protein YdiY
LSAGISGAAGNSENLNANAQLSLKQENEHLRRNFLAAYYHASTDGIASSNSFLAELNNDWLLGNSPWFLFGQGNYDYDEFRAWDHRIASSLGAGYDFVDTDTLTLRGRTGVGYSQTFGDEQESRPEALAGLEAKWHITPQQNVEFSSSFHPDLSDTPEFRTLTSLNWNIALLSMKGLGLKIGAVHEYESDTESMKNFDLRYYGNLSYDF